VTDYAKVRARRKPALKQKLDKKRRRARTEYNIAQAAMTLVNGYMRELEVGHDVYWYGRTLQ
jgi:hypothetical protein